MGNLLNSIAIAWINAPSAEDVSHADRHPQWARWWHDRRVEILPSVGVEAAKVGEHRDIVEARIGQPIGGRRSDRALYATTPQLDLTYAADNTVELVSIWYAGDGREEVYFDGVQLTYRLLDDVVADLAAKGYRYESTDIGFKFEPGFAVWSMHSRWAGELDPDAAQDDPRAVCEGVSVAPYDHFDPPTPEEMEAFRRNPPWSQ